MPKLFRFGDLARPRLVIGGPVPSRMHRLIGPRIVGVSVASGMVNTAHSSPTVSVALEIGKYNRVRDKREFLLQSLAQRSREAPRSFSLTQNLRNFSAKLKRFFCSRTKPGHVYSQEVLEEPLVTVRADFMRLSETRCRTAALSIDELCFRTAASDTMSGEAMVR